MISLEELLTFLKYLGLVIATISSLVGITGDFTRKIKGKKILSKSGILAIMLTCIGLLTSAFSNYFQDRIDQNKASKKIAEDNRRQFEELRRFQVQSQNLSRLQFQQLLLAKKQDSARRVFEKKQFEQQIKSNTLLVKQMLVDNYLNSKPASIDIVFLLPFNIKHVHNILDSANLSLVWQNKNESKIITFWISGSFKSQESMSKYISGKFPHDINKYDFYFLSQNDDKVGGSYSEYTEEVTSRIEESRQNISQFFLNMNFYKFKLGMNNSGIGFLKKKNSKETLLFLNISSYRYTYEPWDKIVDLRNNAFTYILFNAKFKSGTHGTKNWGLTDTFTEAPYIESKCYLRIDGKYLLQLNNNDYLNEATAKYKTNVDESSKDWKVFRSAVERSFSY